MNDSPTYPPIVVSVHVPKCAGTSFRLLLEDIYGPRLWANYGGVFTRADARPGCVPAGTAVIHGHFMADAFDDVLRQPTFITWVRNPVERVVSNYHHFLRSPDMRDDCCRAVHERRLSLRAFAELDWMRNGTMRYLAGKSVEDFAAVGIAERFEESLGVIASALGWSEVPEARRDNVNPLRRANSYELSLADWQHIAELNAGDFAWYARAQSALDCQLRQPVMQVA